MISADIKLDEKLINTELAKVPALVQAAAFESGLRPAANVVAKRVRALTPRSANTGTTTRWSRGTKIKRQGEKPLHETVGIKIQRPKNSGAYALTGFQWPKGNKAYFILPMKSDSRKLVAWGRDTGRRVRKGNDFLRQAFDETKGQQSKAFQSAMVRKVAQKLRKLRDGRP